MTDSEIRPDPVDPEEAAPSRELELDDACRQLLAAVCETRRVEIEIVAGNRGKFRDQLFAMDAVIGYAKDERLIEYKVVDRFQSDWRKSTKTIIIYPYGENDDGPNIIRRRPGDPSGNWGRFFRGFKTGVLSSGAAGNQEQPDHPTRGAGNLPAGNAQAKLLDPASARS